MAPIFSSLEPRLPVDDPFVGPLLFFVPSKGLTPLLSPFLVALSVDRPLLAGLGCPVLRFLPFLAPFIFGNEVLTLFAGPLLLSSVFLIPRFRPSPKAITTLLRDSLKVLLEIDYPGILPFTLRALRSTVHDDFLIFTDLVDDIFGYLIHDLITLSLSLIVLCFLCPEAIIGDFFDKNSAIFSLSPLLIVSVVSVILELFHAAPGDPGRALDLLFSLSQVHALLFIYLLPVVMSLLQAFLPPLLGQSITGELSLALAPLLPVAAISALRITFGLSDPAFLRAITGHSPALGPVFSMLIAAFAATSLEKGAGKVSFMGFFLEGVFHEVGMPKRNVENIRF